MTTTSKRRNRSHFCIAAYLASALSFSALAQEKQTAPPSPAQVVTHFVSLAHGLYRLSPADRSLLARVKANPDPYVAAVRARYPGAVFPALTDQKGAMEWERIALLLAAIDSPGALQLLGSWFVELDARQAGGGSSPPAQLAARERAMVIDALGSRKVDVVVQRILSRVDAMDSAGRAGALQYLARATPGDPAVATKLRSLLADKRSRLYGDPALARTLAAIERGYGSKKQ